MDRAWRILIVDDEEDIHVVTKLCFKRRTWKNKGFETHHAYSAAEAQALLAERPPFYFQVALVDVVMETSTAGLDLCQHIRRALPPSLRLILRTGQPGVAPKERILNEYDIDYYFSKPEVTDDNLFNSVRACLRSYEDVSTILAFSKQLQDFAQVLPGASSPADLLLLMGEGLKFIEAKYAANLLFLPDITKPDQGVGEALTKSINRSTLCDALSEKGNGADDLSLPSNASLTPFSVDPGGEVERIRGGLLAEFDPKLLSDRTLADFKKDMKVYLENWKMAYGNLVLHEQVTRQKMLREKMYLERMESLTGMVAGIAHEVNTPLGVIRTAVSMVRSLSGQLTRSSESDSTQTAEETAEIAGDLQECIQLLDRNIDRADHMIQSFKKLSSDQLHDELTDTDLAEVARDCIEIMKPQTKKKKLSISLNVPEGTTYPWTGYPGHLSQVLLNFIQNTLRYGYPDGAGEAEFSVRSEKDGYLLEFSDSGKGIPPQVVGRVFEPFVTTGRGAGGTGLGLAISHNIVTQLLHGSIECHSELNQGARFSVRIPRVIKERTSGKGLKTVGV